MSALERIAEELQILGYLAEPLEIPDLGGERAVVFEYPVLTGRFRTQTFRVGIAFQEEGYPEYPPHFIWVANLPGPQLQVHNTAERDGEIWASFSAPPGDFWDQLPTSKKNMKSYINTHLVRFWNQV